MANHAIVIDLPMDLFEDIDGDAITYSTTLVDGSSPPSWLSFDSNQLRFKGRAPNNAIQDWPIKVTGTDAGQPPGMGSTTFVLSVTVDPFPWHNHIIAFDVDDSGAVFPTDAILVINQLNAFKSGPLPVPLTEPLDPPRYVDTSRDNLLAPLDAILVINYLNRRPVGENESVWETSNTSPLATVPAFVFVSAPQVLPAPVPMPSVSVGMSPQPGRSMDNLLKPDTEDYPSVLAWPSGDSRRDVASHVALDELFGDRDELQALFRTRWVDELVELVATHR